MTRTARETDDSLAYYRKRDGMSSHWAAMRSVTEAGKIRHATDNPELRAMTEARDFWRVGCLILAGLAALDILREWAGWTL